MAYITLEQAKDHLNIIDFIDDDPYINELILVAEAAVANEISESLDDLLDGGRLPYPIHHAILLMVGNLYKSREPVVIGVSAAKIPYTIEYLLYPYKNWTCK